MINNRKKASTLSGDGLNSDALPSSIDASESSTIPLKQSIHPKILKRAFDSYCESNSVNLSTKRKRIIAWLMVSSKLNAVVTRFDAEWVNDHCFNTTVSEIERKDGIKVNRRHTKRPCAFGKTDCKEYWLTPSSIDQVERLLGVKNG